MLDFMDLSRQVSTVLSESIQRMETSYNNYVDVEKAVLTSLTPIPVESSPKFGRSGLLPTSILPGINLGPGPVVNPPSTTS
jgi:hypothetical protein